RSYDTHAAPRPRGARVAAGNGSELAALLPVASRLADERFEQLHVLAGLRMPEDAEREAPVGRLDCLDRTVLRLRGDTQTVADSPEPLVVMRLHGSVVPEEPGETRPWLERDVVVGERARRVLVLLVADDVGKVLHEVAAAGDVED